MVTEVKIIIALVILGMLGMGIYEWRHSLIEDGEQKIQAAIAATTTALQAKNTADLAAQHAVDIANITQIGATYAQALAASNTTVDDLNSRLRAYASASRRGLALPGDPATPAGPDDATGSTDRVTEAVAGVNIAAARDAAKVIGLQSYIEKVCH